MNKRICILWPVLLILILSTLACGISMNIIPEPPVPTSTPTQVITDAPAPEVSSLVSTTFEESEETPPYTVSAQIPFLQGNDGPKVQLFNQLVNDLVHGDIDNFRTIVLQDAPNPSIALGSSYDLHYELLSPPGDIMSIIFDIDTYFDGAAHQGSTSLTINIDLATGQQLDLHQLFIPGANYLSPIATYCQGQLSKRDISFFEAGAEPIPENYRNWNITADGLLISFDPYQVAAYSAGPQAVLIPYSELRAIIDNSGPLAGTLE